MKIVLRNLIASNVMSAANFKGEEAKTLHILQNIEFSLTGEENSFSKADLLRSKMKEIQHAASINTISKESSLILLDKYFGQYCAILDSTDPVHGLNNYAEVSLHFAEHKKNEYAKWTSGMTAESLRSNPKIRSMIAKSEENKAKLDKEITQILQHKLPEKIHKKFEFDKRTNNAAIPTNSLKHNLDNIIQKPIQTGKLSSNQYKCGNRSKRKHEDEDDDISVSQNPAVPSTSHFRTARDQLMIAEALKKNEKPNITSVNLKYGLSKKSVGKPTSKFTSPLLQAEEKSSSKEIPGFKMNDDKLCNIDSDMIEKIRNEIMDCGSSVTWDDIAGLEFAKKNIMEIVVWPMLRPDIFHGLRGPAKGLLLFGPPGTGKTLIGKCIACQSKATFFSISASSLTSKWIGEGEKMVRALFAVARCCQPSVIFIDEIDSLLTQRSDSEHESSRRIKTEFLVQFDGAATSQEDRILVIGATNRPQELDEAARRRLVKRLYIPLPEPMARKQIIVRLLLDQKHNLTEDELDDVCEKTDGYSGSDMTNLCSEAALGPIRSISSSEMSHISTDQVRHIAHQDFMDALHQVKASVSPKDLQIYKDWNDKFGSTSRQH